MNLKHTESGQVLILNYEDFQVQESILFQPDNLICYLIYNQVIEIEIEDSIGEEIAEFINTLSYSPVKLLKLDISHQNSFNSKTYESLIYYISKMKPNSNLAIDIISIAVPQKGFSQFLETLENNQNILNLEYYNSTKIRWDENIVREILDVHKYNLLQYNQFYAKRLQQEQFAAIPENERYWPIPKSLGDIIAYYKYVTFKTWKKTLTIKHHILEPIQEVEEENVIIDESSDENIEIFTDHAQSQEGKNNVFPRENSIQTKLVQILLAESDDGYTTSSPENTSPIIIFKINSDNDGFSVVNENPCPDLPY